MLLRDLIAVLTHYDPDLAAYGGRLLASPNDSNLVTWHPDNINKLNKEVTCLTTDSRQVTSSSVFVALRGYRVDSHQYMPEVEKRNPLALIIEDARFVSPNYHGLVLPVTNTREALNRLSRQFYGDPSRQMTVIGVTGTNGKTSCAYLLEHICICLKIPTGVIGTIDHHMKLLNSDKLMTWSTGSTTPDPIELQKRLAEMQTLGAKVVAMEVSSHALHQTRADSVHFNVALFTNLSREHLDYHRRMRKYYEAKQRLFNELLWRSRTLPRFAVVNIDDIYGRRLRVAGVAGLWTYGQRKEADFHFKIRKSYLSSTEFDLYSPLGEFKVTIPLCGLYNVYNTVGTIAAVNVGLNAPLLDIIEAVKSFPGVPGRLQRVPLERDLHVFVDYAHTPDALKKVLLALRSIQKSLPPSSTSAEHGSKSKSLLNNKQKIITVFGCGGDRDKGKRPYMGEVAESYSDVVIITSDNPRTEDPLAIISEILPGFRSLDPLVEPNRRAAIELALKTAQEGDIILLAGKGHEECQIIGSESLSFSDFEIVQELMQ